MSSFRIHVHVAGRHAVVMQDLNTERWGVADCGQHTPMEGRPIAWLCYDGESWQEVGHEGDAIDNGEVILMSRPSAVLDQVAIL